MDNKNELNKNIKKFMKWSKACIIITIITAIIGVGGILLSVLKKLTNIEQSVPFLFGKAFMWSALAVFFALVILEVCCYLVARKYEKLLEKSGGKNSNSKTGGKN